MQVFKLSLVVAVTLSLTACCSTQSMPPTVPRNPPEACLTACATAPVPKDGSDREIRFWEYNMIDSFGECRRLHADCVEWQLKEK